VKIDKKEYSNSFIYTHKKLNQKIDSKVIFLDFARDSTADCASLSLASKFFEQFWKDTSKAFFATSSLAASSYKRIQG